MELTFVHCCIFLEVHECFAILTSITKDELREFLAGIAKEALADGVRNPSAIHMASSSDNEPMVKIDKAAKIVGPSREHDL